MMKEKELESMKLAAIKGKMGIWNYYVTAMRFEDIVERVDPISEEISNNKSFSNMLQRAITDNVDGIKDYIINQQERFFNALVLAVYDGNPEWFELEMEVEDFVTYSVGVLELSGREIIFPVDGQHRVEGIRASLEEKPELRNEKVPVILIGHENSKDGKRRTRRLFSTLNRRARKVNNNEFFALDEDDVVAVATREIIEKNPLFEGERLINAANKNIPSSNHRAFTSILELYECNKLIFDYFTSVEGIKPQKKKEMFLYRPDEEIVDKYTSYINQFWNEMQTEIPSLNEYVNAKIDEIDSMNKRSEEGGDILFRPIALTQYINAVIFYLKKKNCSISEAIREFNKVPMKIQDKPWKHILWTSRNGINGRVRKKDVMNMMIYCVDASLLSKDSVDSLLLYWGESYGITSLSEEGLREIINNQ